MLEQIIENDFDWTDDNGEITDRILITKSELYAFSKEIQKQISREIIDKVDSVIEWVDRCYTKDVMRREIKEGVIKLKKFYGIKDEINR